MKRYKARDFKGQTIVCPVCGQEFSRTGPNQKFCSGHCRQVSVGIMAPHELVCPECGKMFIAYHGNTKYCSVKCLRKCQRRHNYFRNDKRYFDQLKKNGYVDRSISLKDVILRDNGICQICGEPVDMDDISVRPDGSIVAGGTYPSIDHIIPVSRGGTHTWNNVQLAHRCCNSAKGDSTLPPETFAI